MRKSSEITVITVAATLTGQMFLSIELVLPEPSAVWLVVAAGTGGPQTSNPEASKITHTGLVERELSQAEAAYRLRESRREEDPEWRHVTQGARQNRQQQEYIRGRHQTRIDAHFVERNRPRRCQ